MRRTAFIAIISLVWIGMSAATVSAQMFPRSRYDRSSYDGYDDGALAAAAALNSSDNSVRNNAQAYQAWRQQAASSQMSGMESGIRNAMNAGDQQYAQNLYDRQQAGRDWWFQVEQQQLAERQAQASRYAAMSAGFESAPAANAPKANTDIIKWPPLLQAPQFAAQRAQIEAPYRRNSKGLSTPTADDYQNMIKAAERMKAILKGMTANITAEEYFDCEPFLDQLAAEARERIEQAAAKK
jgi:hypothetical protein